MQNSNSIDQHVKDLYTDPDVEVTSKHITSLYGAILSSITTYGINDNGHVCRKVDDNLIPITVNEKSLVLPTRSNLRREDNDDLQFFHPLSENIMRGESLIISTLLKYITLDVNVALTSIIMEYAVLLSDDNNIERMNTDQIAAARLVGFKDAKFTNYAKSVFKAMMGMMKNKEYPISFFLKSKATVNEKLYNRGCMVSFELDALYDEIDSKYAGVKEPKKGYAATMNKLVQSIFPKHATTNAYSYGTYSATAPYFCSLIGGWVNVKKAINEFCSLYSDLGLFQEDIVTDLSWYGGDELNNQAFENAIKSLSDLIPAIDGNVGSGGKLGGDTATNADRAKMMNTFLNEVSSTVGDRSEASTSSNTEVVKVAKADSDISDINPELLKRFNNNITSSPFGNTPNQSVFGNNQQGNVFSSGGSNNGSIFGNSNRSIFDTNRRDAYTPNATSVATLNVPYTGIRL